MKQNTNGVIKNCKAKIKAGKNIVNVISYLFSMEYEEPEVLEIMQQLGFSAEEIKDKLMYDFGLDPETIMGL